MRISKRGDNGGVELFRRRRWTLRRVAMWAGCLLIGALVAGELGARYIVGLGDPPLFMLDPEIEYLLRPDQKCRRFGHDYIVNSHSMRSEEFATLKPKGQLRVMVIGDSVVNGGGKIDQSELATTLLQRGLAASLKRDVGEVVVGNISASSWGPPNQLAFVKKYGLFDADVLVIVSNSDDWDDVPGLEYIGSAWPREKPWCALQELIGVYGWKAVCKAIGRAPEPPPPVRSATHDEDIEQCRIAYGELIALAQQHGAKVAVVQWLKKSELAAKPQPGYDAILSWAKQANVPALRVGSGASLTVRDLFQPGDDVHPSASGHEMLAKLLETAVQQAVGSPDDSSTPAGTKPPEK